MAELIRHPSEYFIKYLITLPQAEAKSDDWVRFKVQQLGYPAPLPPYVAQLRQILSIDFPLDYQPADRYNRESVKYLRKHGIWQLHNPDNDTREATQILIDLQVRKVVEQLLLGRLDPKEVANKVNSRFRKFLTGDVITLYGHYFWNCSLLKASDWVLFFEQYERAEQAKSLAIVQGGGGMALHAAGFRQDIDTKDIMKDMLQALRFDFMDWNNQPRSESRTRAFATLAKAVTALDERMSESSTAVRDHLAAFKQWQMTHAPKNIKGIEDIAPHGNFSDSGAELKELPEKTK